MKQGAFIVKFKVFGKGFKTRVSANSEREAREKLAGIIAKNTEIVGVDLTPEDVAEIEDVVTKLFGAFKK